MYWKLGFYGRVQSSCFGFPNWSICPWDLDEGPRVLDLCFRLDSLG